MKLISILNFGAFYSNVVFCLNVRPHSTPVKLPPRGLPSPGNLPELPLEILNRFLPYIETMKTDYKQVPGQNCGVRGETLKAPWHVYVLSCKTTDPENDAKDDCIQCSGTLISPSFILSSSACTHNYQNSFKNVNSRIFYGINNFDTSYSHIPGPENTGKIVKFIYHPDQILYPYALGRVVAFNGQSQLPNVMPICLPDNGDCVGNESSCSTTSWKQTFFNSFTIYENWMYNSVEITESSICKSDNLKNVCTVGNNDCDSKDAGEFLTCTENANSKIFEFLYGFGKSCRNNGNTEFVRATEFLEWIETETDIVTPGMSVALGQCIDDSGDSLPKTVVEKPVIGGRSNEMLYDAVGGLMEENEDAFMYANYGYEEFYNPDYDYSSYTKPDDGPQPLQPKPVTLQQKLVPNPMTRDSIKTIKNKMENDVIIPADLTKVKTHFNEDHPYFQKFVDFHGVQISPKFQRSGVIPRNNKFGKCKNIMDDDDITWEMPGQSTGFIDFKSLYSFDKFLIDHTTECTKPNEGDNCRVATTNDGACEYKGLRLKRDILVQKQQPDGTWSDPIDTRSFICAYDSKSQKMRWARQTLGYTAKYGDKDDPTSFGKFKVLCGTPNCDHPSLWTNKLLDINAGFPRSAMRANINSDRNATWICRDSDRNIIEYNNNFSSGVPVGGKCSMHCSNDNIPDPHEEITCESGIHKQSSQYKDLERLYEILNHKRWNKSYGEDMVNGWKCIDNVKLVE